MVLTAYASTAAAQQPQRAAVVPLDDAARSRGLDAEAARVLRPTQMTVLQGEELDSWLRKRREPEPSSEVLAQFAPATETIAKGVERFFYMSPERALPSIEPVLDLAWNNPAVLAFRPDLADQIWQAGIVLVRAYAATKGHDEALAQAERLVTLLPTRETDPKLVPPDARKLLEEARVRLAAGGATLRLSAPDPERCTLYVNGARAQPQQTYVVDPSGSYFAHADCSQPSTPPIWRAIIARDRAVEMLVPPVEPQSFRPASTTEEVGRRAAEWYLQATAQLADTDVTVGVASPADDEAVVLVRYDRTTQTITWSDADYAGSIRRGMPRIFPEYANLLTDGAEPPTVRATAPAPRGVDWPGFALVALGGAAAGTGTVLLVTSARQSRLLDCAVNNPSPPQDPNCDGLRDDIFFDDFSRETRKVGSARAVGVVLVGTGAIAIGYGVYRLIRGPSRAPEAAGVRVAASGLEVRW